MMLWFCSNPGAKVMIAFSERPVLNRVSILSARDEPSISTRLVRLSRGMLVPIRLRFATLEFLARAPKIRPILSDLARHLFITKSVI